MIRRYNTLVNNINSAIIITGYFYKVTVKSKEILIHYSKIEIPIWINMKWFNIWNDRTYQYYLFNQKSLQQDFRFN